MQSYGVGIAFDLKKVKVPLPGRVMFEVRYWDQTNDHDSRDPDSCVLYCDRSAGLGFALQYEQLLTNMVGMYFGTRHFNAREPLRVDGQDVDREMWFAVGPMFEMALPALTIGRFGLGSINVQGGVMLRSTSAPRFELRLNFGIFRFSSSPTFGVKVSPGH